MTISVIRDKTGAMRHQIRVGKHILTVDEPATNGGEDSGPTPHDLYDAALGACKALTMLWYAKRNGIDLQDIHVGVERDASQEREGVYRLVTRIAIDGNLTDAQHARLIEVAGKCPVHKLMAQVRTEIETIAV